MTTLSSVKVLTNNAKCEQIKKAREWIPSKQWNPFNSYKLLAHVERWRKIKRGRSIPPPILITVDPTNVCNLNCKWCNAAYIRKERKGKLSEKILLDLADFLPRWGEGSAQWEAGVQAVCIAGGGEPLLNTATASFIDALIERDIEVGIVTNGSMINKYIDSLSHCTWVGVSVDAGTSSTFNMLKGLSPENDTFARIIENISTLVDYSKRHNNKLGYKHPAYGISYKYLLYRDNIDEVYEAAKLAKEIGCKNIHFRPAGTTWDKIGTEEEVTFSQEDISLFNEQIEMALELGDQSFGVYGVTHKFDSQFSRANFFDKCYALFMTAVIEPPSEKDAPPDSMVMGVCCDRRGDEKLELAKNIQNVEDINQLWGSDVHWQMHDRIIVEKECPRCTYQPHNQIYEQVILNDSMTHKFI
jgi:sulfatase maturation enzyme AslB (radical SAM superfamily)